MQAHSESRSSWMRKTCLVLVSILLLCAISSCNKKSTTTIDPSSQQAVPNQVSSQQPSGILSGSWSGAYYYKDGSSVAFSGGVQQEGEKFSGKFTEPRTTFGPMMGTIEFTFTGTVKDNHVNMEKTYAYDKTHKVTYTGTYFADEKKIKGEWVIGQTTGRFEITIQ